MQKIIKWLENQGYSCKFIKCEMYRHSDSFHKGEFYYMDLYKINPGELYIRAKEDGKKRYYLCKDRKSTLSQSIMMTDFSQRSFISRAEKYFSKGGK